MEKIYSLFSGGKDSFAVASWLQERGQLAAVVLLDTGISIPGWEAITRGIADKAGFPVEVYRTNIRYEWLVWKYGFPGKTGHRFAMNYLKGRAIREFKKAHPGATLASGVRVDESARRALTTKEWGEFEGVKVWAPLYNWTTKEVWEYVRSKGYERPQSYITLGTSGDCLCGAFAGPHERERLESHYPDIYQRIQSLEEMVEKAFPTRCRWGWMNEHTPDLDDQESLICQDCSKRKEG